MGGYEERERLILGKKIQDVDDKIFPHFHAISYDIFKNDI